MSATNGQRAAQQPVTLEQFLAVRSQRLAEALPRSCGLTPKKLINLAILATRKNSDLARCDMASVFECLLQCAELGLEPGPLGGAYLVPYKTTCTLIIGYRGFIDLARRSGNLLQIEAHVVHERDKFFLRLGQEPRLDHEPFLDGDPGKPRLAYVIARLADGGVHVEYMSIAEIDRIRSRSRASKSGPWVTDYEEMAKKTVARRAAKWLPMSTELAKAIEHDEGEVVESTAREEIATDASVLPPQTQTNKVKAMLAASASKPAFIDVKPDETEAEAIARTQAEASSDEPPPPGDEDAPPEMRV